MAIQEGAPAPDIQLPDDAGQTFQLSAHKGKDVVVYFYPKADTPGCTTEACEFRDAFPRFEGVDAMIVGVSPDQPKALAKFKTKFSLPFALLADTEHAVADAYGVWKEKSMYGKKYMGIERTTVVIGKDGRVKKIFNKVKPAGHAAEVLAAVSGS